MPIGFCYRVVIPGADFTLKETMAGIGVQPYDERRYLSLRTASQACDQIQAARGPEAWDLRLFIMAEDDHTGLRRLTAAEADLVSDIEHEER